MKITFTADDGTHFQTEEDCRAYEAVSDEIACIWDCRKGDPAKLGFQRHFTSHLTAGFGSGTELMKYAPSLLRLAELLQPKGEEAS